MRCSVVTEAETAVLPSGERRLRASPTQVRNWDGTTPLIIATKEGHAEVVAGLLQVRSGARQQGPPKKPTGAETLEKSRKTYHSVIRV